jgi:hypothetical protein
MECSNIQNYTIIYIRLNNDILRNKVKKIRRHQILTS